MGYRILASLEIASWEIARYVCENNLLTADLHFEKEDVLLPLFGEHDCNLRQLEALTSVSIAARGSYVHFSGPQLQVQIAQQALTHLHKDLEQKGGALSPEDVEAAYRFSQHHLTQGAQHREIEPFSLTFPTSQKKVVTARSPNQSTYMQAMMTHHLVFGVGPAGSGKTYLAVAMGVFKLLKGEVDRLILSRPAVEAGERLGFLPGDLKDKVDPYLRPLYDALYHVLPAEMVAKKIQQGIIEIAPLAYMRGRTLSNAYVILDEAQNTTPVQMKMLLTRMGEKSWMVITGDLSQVDLPKSTLSGLQDALDLVQDISDIVVARLYHTDIMRHPLVSKIVQAYDAQKKKETPPTQPQEVQVDP